MIMGMRFWVIKKVWKLENAVVLISDVQTVKFDALQKASNSYLWRKYVGEETQERKKKYKKKTLFRHLWFFLF